MPSRYIELIEAARGYQCSGIGSIAFDGHTYFQAGQADDFGLAELVAAVSRWTGMTLARSFDATDLGLIVLSILIGFAGFRRLCTTRRAFLAGVGLYALLLAGELVVADVYVFQAAAFVAGIPWLVYFGRSRREGLLLANVVLMAFSCSWLNMVRSGTSALCFAFLVPFAAGRKPIWKGALLLVAAVIACLPAKLATHRMMERRDAFLAISSQPETAVSGHPVWHSIYIGLGFIPNAEVRSYADGVAIAKVASIDASAPFVSPRYEAILEREVFRIAKTHPLILIENLAAKTAILASVALVLLFPVRRAVFSKKSLTWVDLAFGLAILVSSLSGILVIPKPRYLLSFVCLTALYSTLRFIEAFSASRGSSKTDANDAGIPLVSGMETEQLAGKNSPEWMNRFHCDGTGMRSAQPQRKSDAVINSMSHENPVYLYVWTGNAEKARACVAEHFPGAEVREILHHEFRKSSLRDRLKALAGFRGRAILYYFRSLDDSKHLQLLKCMHWLNGCRESHFVDEEGRWEVVRASTFLRLIPSLAWSGMRDVFTLATWWCRMRMAAGDAKPIDNRAETRQIDVGYLIHNATNMGASGGAMSHICGFLGGLRSLGGTCRVFCGVPLKQNLFPNEAIPPERRTYLFWEAASLAYNSEYVRGAAEKMASARPSVLYQRHARLSVVGAMLSKQLRLPLILEYNGSEVWIAEHWDPTPFKEWVWLCEEVSIRSASRIMVVSDVLRKELIERGIAAERVVVNPNGVDPETFRPGVGGPAIREELGISADEIVVGFVGSFSLWHGIEIFQKSITQLCEGAAGAKLRFVLVGDGLLREPMRLAVKAHESSGRVIFTGIVAHNKVPDYLDAADILVSPHIPMPDGSSFFGSPTKLFEYMAMGKGIVASRLDQLAKVLEHNRTAVLVTPGDVDELSQAILYLASNEDKRAALGAAARQTVVDHYSWAHNAARALDNSVAANIENPEAQLNGTR
jgi:glycosyltransferase involved in cell wall biosynthesis